MGLVCQCDFFSASSTAANFVKGVEKKVTQGEQLGLKFCYNLGQKVQN